jgi:hypothetical protein
MITDAPECATQNYEHSEVLGQANTVNKLDAMEHAYQLFGDYSINRRIESNGVR